jgi:threonyl-tRNA synthetase
MSEKFFEHCEKIAEQLEANQIRVDIDDRTLTLQKRIREAETEWIPYVVVIGEREIESNVLPVRDRRTREIRNMTLKELIEEIKSQVGDKPFKPLPLPKRVSKRPQFYG